MKSSLDHARVLLQKAANDLELAEIGLEHDAHTDTIAFHLQQAAEKTLKALLASNAVIYPKTHDLDELLDLMPPALIDVSSYREKFLGWTSYAVDIRYDLTGYPAKDEMMEALKIARELHSAAVGLTPSPPQVPGSAEE